MSRFPYHIASPRIKGTFDHFHDHCWMKVKSSLRRFEQVQVEGQPKGVTCWFEILDEMFTEYEARVKLYL